jgi:imidazolonepropionase-like amidohydrolase
VLDGVSEAPREGVTIVLDGERIVSVGASADVEMPVGAEVVDVRGMNVLPGLIDLHVHLCAAPGSGSGPNAPRNAIHETELVLWGADNARLALEAGFTTVRDAFSFHGETAVLSLRQAAESGLVKGPRIKAAGYSGMTGSIVDMRFPPSMPRPYGYTADGPWELRRRTREVIRDGFDWIKTFTSGGRSPGVQEDDTWYTNHTVEELSALIDEAHTFDVKVMIHATTREAIYRAVLCGADTIEHGWPLDDELIQMMIDRGTVLVPTLSVYSERGFLRPEVPEALRTRAERQVEIRMSSFEQAYKAGVKIANGSDIAPSLPTMRHGENAFELAHMVRGGMTPSDAIRAATSGAAEVLGMSSEIGSIEEGKCADLIVVEGDPLEDIGALEYGLRYVFRDGRMVHEQPAETPQGRDTGGQA